MKKISRKTFVGAAALSAASLLALPQNAHAVTAAEKKAEAQAAKEKLDSISSQVESAVDSYNQAQMTYDAATAEVESCQAKINEAQEKIANLQTKLNTRATSMYRSGSMSYLDVLLGTASFGDFATVWDTLNNLNADDADLVSESKAAKQELENTKEELAANQQAAKAAVSDADTYKAQVEAKQAEYDSLYNSLSSEYQTLVAEEQAAAEKAAARASSAYSPSVSSSGSSKKYASASSIPTNGSVVDYAASRIGCPYVYGASGPDTFDCSGLVMWCYAKIGISLPHNDASQKASASAILNPEDAQAGDVLWRSGHVAISTGGTNYIHAPHTGAVVSYGSGGRWSCALRF